MQPTFLPWAGYFNLMQSVNAFIFLDDVQLEKQSWQTRNRIIINAASHWISIPIQNQSLSQRLNETSLVNNAVWKSKLERSFDQNYGKHPYYHDAKAILSCLIADQETTLSRLNVNLITFIAQNIGIPTPTFLSSDCDIVAPRTSRLLALCDKFACDEYLSPPGSASYLADDDFVGRSRAKLVFQNYVPRPYPQKNSNEFIPNLSIVDVIANIGWKAAEEYIKGN